MTAPAPGLPEDVESVIKGIDPLKAIADWENADDIAHAVKAYVVAQMRPAIAAHIAPPVAPTVEAALAALDVEEVSDGYNHVRYPTILGLDDVRAAHRAEVDAAVKAEREACAAICVEQARSFRETLARNEGATWVGYEEWRVKWTKAAEVAESIAAAIRARGVAKPRTDGEASEQGAKS